MRRRCRVRQTRCRLRQTHTQRAKLQKSVVAKAQNRTARTRIDSNTAVRIHRLAEICLSTMQPTIKIILPCGRGLSTQ